MSMTEVAIYLNICMEALDYGNSFNLKMLKCENII